VYKLQTVISEHGPVSLCSYYIMDNKFWTFCLVILFSTSQQVGAWHLQTILQDCSTENFHQVCSLEISNNQFTVQGSQGMRTLQFRIALCLVPCAFCIWLQLLHRYFFVSGRNASSLHRLAPAKPYCVRNSILSSLKYRRSFPVSQRIKLTKQQLEKYQSQKYRRS